jgi:short-subunit dehydrogenase
MKALITGASSGIGRDMAYYLASLNYDLILVARRTDRLEEIKNKVKTNVKIIPLDLGIEDNCFKLYDMTKDLNIDLLINNAGFGLFGNTVETDLERELEMINLNIKAVHILTKLYLKDFYNKDSGRILNVASSAGFLAGPRLNTYYATKNYVLKFTMGIYEELKKAKSNVHISALCPGPVRTEFNKVAGGKFNIDSNQSKRVAKIAIDSTLKNKLIIVPGFGVKLGLFFNRFIPWKLSLAIVYKIQERKQPK